MDPRARAEAHLLRMHDRWPGATARGFGPGRLADGRSSYQLVVAACRPGATVLDLGCGDGHLLDLMVAAGHAARELLGVDLSAAELAAATRRPGLAGAGLIRARAQALPLGPACVDRVVSHLGLSVMAEPDRVVAEAARVLRPGGALVAVVGGGPRRDDGFEWFLARLAAAQRRRESPAVRLGDVRSRSEAGLASLLSPAAGFADLRITDHELALDGSAAEVWQRLSQCYETADLDDGELAGLEAGFRADAAARVGAAGVVPCAVGLKQVVAWAR